MGGCENYKVFWGAGRRLFAFIAQQPLRYQT